MPDFAVSDQLRHVENVNLDAANSRPAAISTYAYTELIASTAEDATWVRVLMCGANSASSLAPIVTIAIGASGSEVDVIEELITYTYGAETMRINNFWLPIQIPAGSRISARSYSGTTTDATCHMMIQLFNGAPCKSGPASRLLNLGYVQIDATSFNVKGPYGEIASSIPFTIHGFMLGFRPAFLDMTAANALVDLAVGAASSEQVILPDLSLGYDSGSDMIYPAMTPLFPLRIPSGSRVALRMQSSTVSSNDIRVQLWGLV